MGFGKKLFYSKKVSLTILVVVLAVWSIAFWYGGRKKWELMGIGSPTAGPSSQSNAYEERLKESPDDPILNYNLAYYYYRQNRFEETEKLLLKIPGLSDTDAELVQKVSYNLGNSLFRLSEKAENIQQAIELLKRSLDQYRNIIESDKERLRYANRHVGADQDAKYNYAVVKKRIKILADKLEQEKNNQQREKELYLLLKELLAQEKQIATQLQLLQSEKSSHQVSDQRNSLLKKRSQNLERLKIVKERMKQVMQPKPPSPFASPII